MKLDVNGMRDTGDPRGIVLRERENIQLDAERRLCGPQPVDWSMSQL
jgi:hypothetical protein